MAKGPAGKIATAKPKEDFAGFVQMCCDGLSQTEAYKRAGFKLSHAMAPWRLWQGPEAQALAKQIFEARRLNGGNVTLSDVTDMLKRVFAASYHAGELPTAHNAAFSLARLHGLVIDRAQITDLRRPSRDPDAPAEIELDQWVKSLPSPQGPSPQGPDGMLIPPSPEGSRLAREFPNDINGLRPDGPGQFENGAPSGPVTGTPSDGARNDPVGGALAVPVSALAEMFEDSMTKDLDPGLPKKKKRGKKRKGTGKPRGRPKGSKNTDTKKPKFPSAKELFG